MGIFSFRSGHHNKVQWRLIRDLVVLLSVLIGTVIWLIYAEGGEVRREVMDHNTTRITQKAHQELNEVFRSFERVAQLMRGWGEVGELSPSDTFSLVRKWGPMLQEIPTISSVRFAEPDGYGLWLIKNEKKMDLGVFTAFGKDPWHWFTVETDQSLIPWDTSNVNPDWTYASWLTGALHLDSSREVFWTPPEINALNNQAQLSISTFWFAPGSEAKSVAAIDILLSDVHQLLNRIQVSDHSRVFLFNSEGKLFIPGREVDQKQEDWKKQVFVDPDEKNEKIVAQVMRNLVLDSAQTKRISLPVGAETWWFGYEPLTRSNDQLFIGVLLPESDFIAEISSGERRFWLIALVLLVIGAGVVAWIISRYSRQIKDLPQVHIGEEHPNDDLLEVIAKGESKHLEFKSTVRYNLRSQKNDKAMEKAWLKGIVGFLNTEGGILLLGVADDGEVLGLDQDGFENEDKCLLHIKNVISTQIGVHVLRWISLKVVTTKDTQVAVVECEPGNEPVYLKDGNEEAFYIRTSAASTKLSVADAVEYVKDHF